MREVQEVRKGNARDCSFKSSTIIRDNMTQNVIVGVGVCGRLEVEVIGTKKEKT